MTYNQHKLRIIITGATGMVGEGVLHECLQHPQVEAVLMINRKPAGIAHPKLKEIIHQDFYNLSVLEGRLAGYNTCLFCLGVSSVGMKEPQYYKLTYTLTMHIAQVLSNLSTHMTFCYVFGAGTDSTEQGRSMWARVKGKTENDLVKLPFKHVYNFRPGFMKPTKGLKQAHTYYTYLGWLYPIGHAIYPKGFITLKELGLAMINTSLYSYDKTVLEGNDIADVAKMESQ